MLPSNAGHNLTLAAALALIREHATQRTIIFAKAASSAILNYRCGIDDVLDMLSQATEADMRKHPSDGTHYPNCDVFTFGLYGRPSELDVDYWYTHVAVNRVTKRTVVVASWKPCT